MKTERRCKTRAMRKWSHALSITIKEDSIMKLRAHADERETTCSQIIRDALRDYWQKVEEGAV
ncbi:ribbon-helix-helix protein, CopG family [uncultured Shimia sp.]|uniref:ribbon-helix-helix protein, CopG family n=1 Tax=uncultured Shimia sp. TaxID=573152 RepID=UPI00261B9647|nr:ribbon-helix-helix protein, CopG family [uncultured Shimia sp.]